MVKIYELLSRVGITGILYEGFIRNYHVSNCGRMRLLLVEFRLRHMRRDEVQGQICYTVLVGVYIGGGAARWRSHGQEFRQRRRTLRKHKRIKRWQKPLTQEKFFTKCVYFTCLTCKWGKLGTLAFLCPCSAMTRCGWICLLNALSISSVSVDSVVLLSFSLGAITIIVLKRLNVGGSKKLLTYGCPINVRGIYRQEKSM